MQDWLLITAPIISIGYFLAHPNEIIALVSWFGRLLH
jgi:hypothetical protein